MIVTNQMPQSISVEAYSTLRTAIKFSVADRCIKTIVVTSAISEEGKSTVSSNLAYSLSKEGLRVLLIDCDLRNPQLHKKFQFTNKKGLTNLLVEKCDVNDIVSQVNSNLFVISAGEKVPNPAELVGSKAMENLISTLSESYDYIVIDTSPLIPVVDAQLIAAKADATILIARAKKTKRKEIIQAYRYLKMAKANVIGTVLNDSKEKSKSKYYKYYGEKDNEGLKGSAYEKSNNRRSWRRRKRSCSNSKSD